MPCHYVVADGAGDSFIYEISLGRNVEHVIDGDGGPQLLTNFELHAHPDAAAEPAGQLTLETEALWRYRTLTDRIRDHDGRFTRDDIVANHARASFARLVETLGTDLAARTLWHAVYDQTQRDVAISFYLGEDASGERRSDYLRFALE